MPALNKRWAELSYNTFYQQQSASQGLVKNS